MKPLTIGKISQLAGVRADTIRYYERRGLIPPVARRASGYRIFPPDTVQRIRFIKRAQQLGFTLEEIQGLLQLSDRSTNECHDVMEIAQEKIQHIDSKVSDLQTIRKALKQLLAGCENGQTPDCPLLECLEQSTDVLDFRKLPPKPEFT